MECRAVIGLDRYGLQAGDHDIGFDGLLVLLKAIEQRIGVGGDDGLLLFNSVELIVAALVKVVA